MGLMASGGIGARERAVAMVFELRAETGNARGSIARVGHRLGINTETLRNWVQKAEVDSGQRPGTTSDDKKRIAELEREVRELRRANEILKAASAYFAGNSTRDSALVGFIDSHKGRFGVERPARFWGYRRPLIMRRRRERSTVARDIRDEELKKEIIRVREKEAASCTARSRSGMSWTATGSRWPGARSSA